MGRPWASLGGSETPLRPKKSGLKMIAANGTEIKHYGQALVKGTDFVRVVGDRMHVVTGFIDQMPGMGDAA